MSKIFIFRYWFGKLTNYQFRPHLFLHKEFSFIVLKSTTVSTTARKLRFDIRFSSGSSTLVIVDNVIKLNRWSAHASQIFQNQNVNCMKVISSLFLSLELDILTLRKHSREFILFSILFLQIPIFCFDTILPTELQLL